VKPGTRINGGTYKVPKFLGNAVIRPYSDFLLHDVGTGDGIPQAAKPEYLDQSTANTFRTAPLWGLRFRRDLMHDGNSPGTEAAITRHGGEATTVRQRLRAPDAYREAADAAVPEFSVTVFSAHFGTGIMISVFARARFC
jgi:CxxC motif-containing protein (DUF1111 family)